MTVAFDNLGDAFRYLQEQALTASGNSSAQPTGVTRLFKMMAHQPVNVLMLGDSNQRMGGVGYDHGIALGFATTYGLVATPFYAMSPSPARNSTDGFASNGGEITTGATTGAPSQFDDLRLLGVEYVYNAANAIGTAQGVTASVVTSGLDVNANVRGHFFYGTFDTGTGSFTPTVRRGDSPFTVLVTGSTIPTNTGIIGKAYAALDLAAGSRNYPVQYQWQRNVASVAPTLALGLQVENRDKGFGVIADTILGIGGASLYDFAQVMQAYTSARMRNALDTYTRIQVLRGHAPKAIVYINSGFNDRNETSSPSLGPNPSNDPTSPAAYIDNLQAIVNVIDAAWVGLGRPLADLGYWIVPCHPISAPDDPQIVSYRAAAKTWAEGMSGRAYVTDVSALISADTIAANGWYSNPATDRIHLNATGYAGLGPIITQSAA
jgi:hypothetical protein